MTETAVKAALEALLEYIKSVHEKAKEAGARNIDWSSVNDDRDEAGARVRYVVMGESSRG